MKKLIPILILLIGCSSLQGRLENTKSNTGLGASPFATGGSFTSSQANAMANAIDDNAGDIADLVTLSGVAANAEHLGTFTGSTIPDSSTIYAALQAIETAYEATAVVEDTPTNGHTTNPISSNWAYDHNADGTKHNDTCTAASGDCGEVMTGNTTTYSRTISAGECHRWQVYTGGNWVWYRQCYGEANATEERQGYVDESGNYIFTGQIGFEEEVTAPTQEASDNSNRVATMAAVQAAIALALGSAGVDTVPDAFTFTDVTDGNVTTEYDDNVTITGIDSTTTISISGGGGEYQINSGSRTSTAGTVALNDVVTVYLTSSDLNSTAVNTTLNVGGVTDTFTITTAAGGGSVCTGDIVFDWPMTADFASADNISGSGGCTVGDAIILLESSATGETSPAGRTGYSLTIPGAYDVASFDISSYDIWDYAAGTITFDFRVATWVNSGWLFSVVGESSQDEFIVMLYDNDEIRVQYEGANAGPVRATTTTASLAIETWYTATVKWRAGATDPSISVEVNGATATATTDLTAFDTAPTEINIGNAAGTAPSVSIKNVRIYNSWQ